jgi:hypothetical protein
MSKNISIHRKDGSKINMNKDGNIWYLIDKSSGPLIGTVKNGYCNIYLTYGLNVETQGKFIPVDRMLLRYADKLKFKYIRMQHTDYEDTSKGKVLHVKYGYIKRDRCSRLLARRKETKLGNVQRLVLLKLSDFTFKEK